MFDEIRLDEVTNYTFLLLLKIVSLYLTREEMKTLLKEIKDPFIFEYICRTYTRRQGQSQIFIIVIFCISDHITSSLCRFSF